MFGFGKRRLISRMEGFHFLAGMMVMEQYRHQRRVAVGDTKASAYGAAMMSALFGTTPSDELRGIVDCEAAKVEAEEELRKDPLLLELVVQTLRVENTLRVAKNEGLVDANKLAILERYGALVPLPPTPASFQALIDRFLLRLPADARQRIMAVVGVS